VQPHVAEIGVAVFYEVRKRVVHERALDGLVARLHQDLVDGDVIRLPQRVNNWHVDLAESE